jgi:hypothetical protein
MNLLTNTAVTEVVTGFHSGARFIMVGEGRERVFYFVWEPENFQDLFLWERCETASVS